MAGTDGLSIRVRPATGADLGELSDLRSRAAADLAAHRGSSELLATVAAIDDHRSGEVLHLVAEIGSVVAGEVVAVAAPGRAGGGTCRLEVLVTDPELRGVGVGHQLLVEARTWATALGLESIEAPALPGDRATKNFLEAHGLVAHLIVARGPLGPPP